MGRVAGSWFLALCSAAFAVSREHAPAAGVSGIVYDSLHAKPLAGAIVQLVGTDPGNRLQTYGAMSDSGGRFQISDVAIGRYLSTFRHPVVDSLGLDLETQVLTVGPAPTRANFAVPSQATLSATVCAPRADSDSTGTLIGHVRRAESGELVQAALVLLEWDETELGERGVTQRTVNNPTSSGSQGSFVYCGVPTTFPLIIRAIDGADSTGFIELQVPPRGLRHITLGVAPNSSARSRAATDSAAGDVAAARLIGRVRNERGNMLGDAVATILGTDLAAKSNSDGVFVLEGLPSGTFMLEVRALGFVPVRSIEQLSSLHTTERIVSMSERVTSLAAIKVTGNRAAVARRLVEFEGRRNGALTGYFIGPEEIDRRPITPVGNLLQAIQGVSVQRQQGTTTLSMLLNGINACAPSIYVDGRRDNIGAWEVMYSDEILAVEVYPREQSRPSQFQDSNRCGVVAFWTRRG